MAATESLTRNVVESGRRAAERSDTSAGTQERNATFRVWRGAGSSGEFRDYQTKEEAVRTLRLL